MHKQRSINAGPIRLGEDGVGIFVTSNQSVAIQGNPKACVHFVVLADPLSLTGTIDYRDTTY